MKLNEFRDGGSVYRYCIVDGVLGSEKQDLMPCQKQMRMRIRGRMMFFPLFFEQLDVVRDIWHTIESTYRIGVLVTPCSLFFPLPAICHEGKRYLQ
jgi:hypothetical protein